MEFSPDHFHDLPHRYLASLVLDSGLALFLCLTMIKQNYYYFVFT